MGWGGRVAKTYVTITGGRRGLKMRFWYLRNLWMPPYLYLTWIFVSCVVFCPINKTGCTNILKTVQLMNFSENHTFLCYDNFQALKKNSFLNLIRIFVTYVIFWHINQISYTKILNTLQWINCTEVFSNLLFCTMKLK